MDRRTFVKGAVAGAGIAATGATAARANLVNLVLPTLGIETRDPRTPVEHIVVVMMENRSVDHFLGWYGAENPAFDGHQQGIYPDLRQGPQVPGGPALGTESWGVAGRHNYHGRGFSDPSHSWSGGRRERAGGSLTGWLDPETDNDEYTLSTYQSLDIPVWAQLTRDYQAYDRWFCSLLGPTQPNRYYAHSGQSGGVTNNSLPPELAGEHPEWTAGWDWPTIWTLCARYGITANYYFSNLPELAFWGARHLTHVRHVANYFVDALTGTLPQVSFVDPWFSFPEGLANDDHPHADIRLGQAFLSDVVEAFVMSPHYQRGAMVITYDEWGGFWDHVDPPRLADDRATPSDPGGDDDFGQVGFRIPSTIISPWTRTPRNGLSAVDHTVYEHSSIIKFIADNWNLPYLTTRQRMTNSIETAFGGFQSYDPEPAFVPYEAPLHVFLEPTLEQAGIDLAEDVLGPVADLVGQVPIPIALASAPPQASALAGPVTGALSGPNNELFRLAELGWFDGLSVNIDHRFEDSFLHSRPELLADATAGLQRLANGAAGAVQQVVDELAGG